MSITAFIKTMLLLNLLNWYRRYFKLDVDDVISPLDETINKVIYHLEEDLA